MIYTWTFDTNARDQAGAHPWKRVDTGAEATVSGGALSVTSVGYVCDITDIDLSRRWTVRFAARDDATSSALPTYFLSVGPVFKSTNIGGAIVHRPAGGTHVRLDDSPPFTDPQRQCASVTTYAQGWHQPYQITYDQMSAIRQCTLYNQGVRCSQKPIGVERDVDTYGKFLYIGCLLDTPAATPCSFDSIELDNDWDGVTLAFNPVVGAHTYYRVRLLGACQVTECALDTVRSAGPRDDGAVVSAAALSVPEGTITDPVLSKLVDLVYNLVAPAIDLTPAASGWTTIQYGYTYPVEMVQLRIAVRATAAHPQWCEISYSNDGLAWYLEDRFQTTADHFSIAGVRANAVATYQRSQTTGAWSFVRNFSGGK